MVAAGYAAAIRSNTPRLISMMPVPIPLTSTGVWGLIPGGARAADYRSVIRRLTIVRFGAKITER
jgi:hypothetical protein